MEWEALANWLLIHGAKGAGGWAPTTVRERVGDLQRMRSEGLDVDPFSQKSGDAYLAARVRDGVSAAAYNNDVVALNGLARYLWRDSEEEPPEWDMRKREKAQKRWLSHADKARLLSYEHDDPEVNRVHRGVLHFALVTGLRPSEAHELTVGDVSWEEGPPRVDVEKTSKNGIRRPLFLSAEDVAPTRPFGAYLRWRDWVGVESPELWIAPYGRSGQMWEPHPMAFGTLQTLPWRIGQAVGVKFSWTIARRTRATELLDAGWPLPYVSRWLGHRKLDTTREYLDISDDQMRRLMQKTPPPSLFKET